ASFVPGREVAVSISVEGVRSAASARMFYRHVNQAEAWQSAAMSVEDKTQRAVIPAAYSQSLFPLQYYFEIHKRPDDIPALYPGLGPSLMNQPYFVVRQSR
ncbi:MAG TPA: hypothetical protein VK797_00195, partial [Tepidisphaeraceae bacterium]|nr:hypothetical protein [Tepidisphaeraceae bacterium]